MAHHIKNSILAVHARSEIYLRSDWETDLEAIKAYVGEETRWLARAVRIVVNTNNWVHTRFAFLT